MNAFREARGRAGLSQEELSAASGITVRTIYNLENGRGKPRAETLGAIAQVLRVPMSELVGEGGEASDAA